MDWIKVEDQLPKQGERVLVYSERGVHGGDQIEIEYIMCDGMWSDDGIYSSISHWMPLPLPPKED